MLDGHVISTGADGRLVGMSASDVEAAVDKALQHPKVVLHFHGGLVNVASGTATAESLLRVYTDAGAYPLFFVWRSGVMEILRNNVLEIAREDLFERLVRRLLGWAVGAVRADTPGARGAMRPTPEELGEALAARRRTTDPDLGREPFLADEQRDVTAAVPELTPAEEASFLTEIEADAQLRVLLAGAAAARQVAVLDTAGGRGIPDVSPIPSRIDDDVLAEIAAGDVDDARGPFSIVALGRKALQVLRAVLSRYRSQTDSGVYPTVVEEVLRAFYLGSAGGALWAAMKKETLDAFVPGSTDRGGRLVVDRLAAGIAAGTGIRVTLVGHSCGAVFVNNLLRTVAAGGARLWPASAPFQVCYLAPACSTRHFAETLDAAEALVGRFRMFTMTDQAEQSDRLVGAVYPRSLLYLVSGLLERDGDVSGVAPLLGMSRYLAASGLERLLDSDLGRGARLATVRAFSEQADRVGLSPSADGALDGFTTSAVHHGDFDDDPLVRRSLAHLIGSW